MRNWWHRLWCRDCRVADWLVDNGIKSPSFLWDCAAIMDCLGAKLRVIHRGHEFRDWKPDYELLRRDSHLTC